MGYFAYLRRKQRAILSWTVCMGLFALWFALYELPIQAVAYPAALSMVILIAASYLGYRAHRRDRLAQMAHQAELDRANAEVREAAEDTAKRLAYYGLWAHQIKTPISAMALQLEESDTPQTRALRLELLRIEQYADMAMAYLRMDAGSTDYVLRDIPLDNVIRGAIRRFSGEFIARKIRLHYEPGTETALTDEKWLRFVLEQLLSNALKYTRQGSITVCGAPGTLIVSDTGIGIAPEDLPRVFEPGYTGLNGRYDQRASGIGLYLCKRILTELGHEISLSSKPGEGTTVTIRFPQTRISPN